MLAIINHIIRHKNTDSLLSVLCLKVFRKLVGEVKQMGKPHI